MKNKIKPKPGKPKEEIKSFFGFFYGPATVPSQAVIRRFFMTILAVAGSSFYGRAI